jgi:hypothetical protein
MFRTARKQHVLVKLRLMVTEFRLSIKC